MLRLSRLFGSKTCDAWALASLDARWTPHRRSMTNTPCRDGGYFGDGAQFCSSGLPSVVFAHNPLKLLRWGELPALFISNGVFTFTLAAYAARRA